MKIWMLLTAAALVPMSVSAQMPVNDGARAELVREIEAARTALLPQTEPRPQVTVRFQPRLNGLKASAVSAKTSAQLTKARKDFGDWKTAVLRQLYGESSPQIFGESYEVFAARRAGEINFVMALRQQFAAQRVEAHMSEVRAASLKPGVSWSGVFDNAAPFGASSSFSAGSSDGAVRAEAPLPANDPARYDKIRALLLSQGISPKIIDTAIAEGRRRRVDPMIVLSVIGQESDFRKNAYNKGSGCTGLMGLDPATAADMGVRGSLYDPGANIKAGVKYLDWIANSFFKMNLDMSDLSRIPAEKLKIVLASYNWGVGNVRKNMRKHGAAALDRVAPRETRDYIAEIPARIHDWLASI